MISVFQVLGGLALFLYGVHVLSDGMEKLAGHRLQEWLDRLTNRPIKGAVFGAAATALISPMIPSTSSRRWGTATAAFSRRSRAQMPPMDALERSFHQHWVWKSACATAKWCASPAPKMHP